MFLDWISQLGLIQHDPQTNILGQLPLSIRRLLISEITGYLHPTSGKQPPDPDIFSSPAHVKWFMEVIGQGFSLPLEDMDITHDDIEIYSKWLFEPETRPMAVEGLEQEFFQIIFHQFSLLFQPRIARSSTNLTSPPPPSKKPHPLPFTHTSNIFLSNPQTNALKETLNQLVQRQIELCKKTLKVIAMSARTLDFSRDTWAVLLKVMLGITDYLLKEPTGENSNLGVMNMGDELCDNLLQVLFELWLRSTTMDVEMWDILKSCFVRWLHRPKTIQQWSSTSLTLTKKVQELIYTKPDTPEGIFVNGSNIKLDLPDDFVYYAWHRVIYLMPQDAPALALQGIGQLIDALDGASGNTLLNMLGTYLFDAAEHESALAILCKLFSRPQKRQRFFRTYIERFYGALMVGLKSDVAIPTLLLSCTELFAADLEGIRMLVPDFLAAIKKVLPKLKIECSSSVDNLRLAAIKVLSTIMCMPNQFGQVSFRLEGGLGLQSVEAVGEEQLITQLIRVLYDSKDETPETPFLSLKFYILEILLMSLRTETSSYNMRYILHLINVYVKEDVPFCPGLVGTVVKHIQDKILTMQLPADVTLVAFDVLMDFVDLYDFIKRDNKNVARELVLALCRYVDTLLTADKLAQTYPLVVQAYDCMIKWILISQWIIDDQDCYKAVIATLSKGITIFEKVETPAEPVHPDRKKKRETGFPPTKQLFQLQPRTRNTAATPDPPIPTRKHSIVRRKEEVAVKMAAEYCMSQFLNQLGRFALPYEHALGGSGVDDLKQESHVKYFLIDQRVLLSIIDLGQQVPSVIVIIRDTTGKYVWSIESRYRDGSGPLDPSPLSTPVPSFDQPLVKHQVSVPTSVAVNESEIPTLDKIFLPDSDDRKQWEAIKVLMDKQDKSEAANKSNFILDDSLTKYAVQPSGTHIDLDNPRGFRLLLAQMGLLLPKNRNHVTPLHLTDTLISEIETLDMLNDRDCISISAYYAKSGNVEWSELIETPPPLSQEFLQFIHCLGWPTKTEDHKGYKGKLDPYICETIPYYSDRTVEFIVNVPYFLKEPPADNVEWGNMNSISKIHQQISSDDHVCVIWIEDLSDYKNLANLIKSSSSPQSKAMVYIFINPLKNCANGLYWIRILIPSLGNSPNTILSSQKLNENALIFGPLVDGIVVSRHALGTMIRSTAISAHQACRVVTDTYTRPYVIRKEYIEEMSNRHRAKVSLSEFYSDIFAEREID